jgi:cyclophilin family peptidyl-prolyl cis-trans isomerase
MREKLIGPLDVALAARPDLAPVRFVKAEILAKLDLWEEAKAEARLALEAVPGLREASFALHLRVGVEEATEGKAGAATDYAGSLARLEARRGEATDPTEIDGIDLARGILLYKRGDFDQALPLLEAVAKRYPFHPPAAENHVRCRKYQEAWAAEGQFRARDAERDDLPRVRIETPRGAVLLELFEDDAPNSVKNFVWLAEHRFLDGSLFHRVVPYFVVQGGDPLSKDPARRAQAGTGGPGYAVPTEPGDQPGQRRRRPFRGMIAMARSPQRNTEGSQFFLTTGTAAHLDGDYSVFGRVLEGQEVVEAIVEGDEIRRVEVVRRREGTVYRPTASSGGPAPEPVARGR